jgi:fumarate reductase subunit C
MVTMCMTYTKQGMSSMEESIFRYVDWGANSVVHVLAKEACTHVANKTWWHSIPPCIGGIIRKEELHPLS